MQEREREVTDDAAAAESASETGRPVPAIAVQLSMDSDGTGALVHEGAIIGSVGWHDDGRPLITLNLGWLRLGGIALKVLDDPERDRHRGGVFLER